MVGLFLEHLLYGTIITDSPIDEVPISWWCPITKCICPSFLFSLLTKASNALRAPNYSPRCQFSQTIKLHSKSNTFDNLFHMMEGRSMQNNEIDHLEFIMKCLFSMFDLKIPLLHNNRHCKTVMSYFWDQTKCTLNFHSSNRQPKTYITQWFHQD